MTTSQWSGSDTRRAQQIWSDFQQSHDVSDKNGQTAGIDPASGFVWLGQSIQDVVAQRDAAGCIAPLYFVRIGSSTYYRKGRCR